ncbi:hypothetical protein FACS1894200_12430 [Spirochaetia bacterium]|nr:hypothetical protein FACS1894200_12430 [Spirochaetia bacterium]
MSDMNSLLKEADELGILNIDVSGSDSLSPEIIETAIQATKRLNERLDKSVISQKLQEADRVVAAQYR